MSILDITEDAITEKYIAKIHFDRLKAYLTRVVSTSQTGFPYVVSIRCTGKYSVTMLNAGAGAKPHSVLGKTIKPGTITAEEAAYAPLVLLYGLVALRKDGNTGDITGIYQPGLGIDHFSRENHETLTSFISRVTGISEEKVRELEGKEEQEISRLMSEDTEQNDYNVKKYANRYMSGDYDLHDLIGKIGRIGPIPSDSQEEFRALNTLNQIMMGIGEELPWDHLVHNPYYPVQHGPQYNYIAHMYAREPEDILVGCVARAAFPVLMITTMDNKIQWKEVIDLDGLKEYYELFGIEMKESWGQDLSEYIARRQDKSFNAYMEGKHKESFYDYLQSRAAGSEQS